MHALDRLRASAERLHLHFDVEPELAPCGEMRATLGLVVRLWGVHAKGARALPGCPKTRAIAAHLRDIAGYALAGDAGALGELEPVRRALYESRVVLGADEVALGIRIVERTPRRTGGATASEERCLGMVRARLRALGASEQ
jgi:hypothetical protein